MTVTPRSVHSIDHYALFVPSLAEARTFFASFGLEVGETADALELRAADGHRWARMLQGPRKSLAYLSFNCFADDYDALRQQAEAAERERERKEAAARAFQEEEEEKIRQEEEERIAREKAERRARLEAPREPG